MKNTTKGKWNWKTRSSEACVNLAGDFAFSNSILHVAPKKYELYWSQPTYKCVQTYIIQLQPGKEGCSLEKLMHWDLWLLSNSPKDSVKWHVSNLSDNI